MVEAAVAWRCSTCGETKPEADFHRANARGKRRRAVQYSCKACQRAHGSTAKRQQQKMAWAAANREKVREWHRAYYHAVSRHKEGFLQDRAEMARWRRRLKKYGITKDQYESMMLAQSGCCAACGDEHWLDLVVDHNHDSGRVRALLCANCNSGIGLLRESARVIDGVKKYLTHHNCLKE